MTKKNHGPTSKNTLRIHMIVYTPKMGLRQLGNWWNVTYAEYLCHWGEGGEEILVKCVLTPIAYTDITTYEANTECSIILVTIHKQIIVTGCISMNWWVWIVPWLAPHCMEGVSMGCIENSDTTGKGYITIDCVYAIGYAPANCSCSAGASWLDPGCAFGTLLPPERGTQKILVHVYNYYLHDFLCSLVLVNSNFDVLGAFLYSCTR